MTLCGTWKYKVRKTCSLKVISRVSALLGYDTLFMSDQIPIFQGSYQVIRCHIPEEWNRNLCYCKDLKKSQVIYCKIFFIHILWLSKHRLTIVCGLQIIVYKVYHFLFLLIIAYSEWILKILHPLFSLDVLLLWI